MLVEYTPDQMFELVDAVERYPDFLPWCGGTSVAFRDEHRTLATIDINYRGIRHSFTTDNRKEPGCLIEMRLVKGPFRSLDGTWRFVGLSQSGAKVEFHLHYEFSSRMLERLIGRLREGGAVFLTMEEAAGEFAGRKK